MAEGWVRLHRKSVDSRVWSDVFLWKLWCWCLVRANWKSGWKHGREIKPGQFVTGRDQAAEQLSCSGSKWYRGMQKLQEWRQITIDANSRFTVVTICNWSVYQGEEDGKRTTDEQPVNSEWTAGEQQMDTIEEGKERKKGKKREGARKFCKPSVEEVEAYAASKEKQIDAQRFWDYYESNGWRVGRGPMKDWKAAVRNWIRNDKEFKRNGTKTTNHIGPGQRYDASAPKTEQPRTGF